MFEYTICNQPDREIFYKQCEALEKKIPSMIKKPLLHDVDDSLIQVYSLDKKEITVYDDYYIGCVHIKSDIDLNEIF